MKTINPVLVTSRGRKIPRPFTIDLEKLEVGDMEERKIPNKSADHILDWVDYYNELEDIFYTTIGKLEYFTLKTLGTKVYPGDTLQRNKKNNSFTVIPGSRT